MRIVDLNKTHRICFAAVAAVVSLVGLASAAAAGRSGFVGGVQSSRPFLSLSARKLAAAPRHKVALVSVEGIDDRGEIVGDVTRNGVRHGYVWQNGSVRLLGSATVAINERGQILGYAKSKARGSSHPVLWENGTRSSIGLDEVYALNDGGQVIGEKGGRAAIWQNGAVNLLPLQSPVALNDLGQVIGETTSGDAAEWQDGTLTDLGPGSPRWINDRGEILGYRNGDVVVWQNGIATDLGPGYPDALNDYGQVIWGSDPQSGIPAQTFLWQDGTTTDIGGMAGILLSNRGQIVGATAYTTTQGYTTAQWWVWQDGTMTRLPAPRGDLRMVAINGNNQIVANVCATDCIRNPNREFVFIWTLKGNQVETQRLGIRQFRRALGT